MPCLAILNQMAICLKEVPGQLNITALVLIAVFKKAAQFVALTTGNNFEILPSTLQPFSLVTSEG